MNVLFLITFLFASAHAKVFQNSYLSFVLPDRWSCTIEQTEWTCRSDVTGTHKEAVIILTAKEAGPGDSLSQYESYLKTPKTITLPNNQQIQSQVRQVKTVQINGQQWIDSLHLNSEVPFYYTRYLATAKQHLAILVTFSAHQRFYTKYSSDFFKAVQSLHITATGDLLNVPQNSGNESPIESSTGLPSSLSDAPPEPTGSSKSKENLFALAVILVSIGLYFFLKNRKKT